MDCGLKQEDSSVNLNPNMPSLKMSPTFALADLPKSSKICGQSGMTVNGIYYQLPSLISAHIKGRESGFLPTPVAHDSTSANPTGLHRRRPPLLSVIFLCCYFKVGLRDWRKGKAKLMKIIEEMKNSSHKNFAEMRDQDIGMAILKDFLPTGRLNPQFVEWLMGYPKNWSRLTIKD